MLGYYLNNEPFLLSEDTSFRLVTYNPCCYFDENPATRGKGVGIPNNKINRALLGSPERFEKYQENVIRKFPGFEIRWFSSVLMAGSLVITDGDADGYTGWVQSLQGVVSEEQHDKKIHEMEWPAEQVYSDAFAANENSSDYKTPSVINSGFWDGIGKEEELNVSYTDPITGITREDTIQRTVLTGAAKNNYNHIINLINLNDIKPGCVVSPFLFLKYYIKKSLLLIGFDIERNDITSYPDYENSFLYNLCILNNFSIVNPDFSVNERTFTYWDYKQSKLVSETKKVVTYDSWTVNNFSYADLVPRISFSKTLMAIQNSLNFVFVFRDHGRVDIIDRNAVFENDPIDVSKYARGTWSMGEQKNVKLKFISEYDQEDAQFSENYEDLSDRIDDFGENVTTFDDLANLTPQYRELRMVEDENNIYEYKWTTAAEHAGANISSEVDILDWVFVSSGPQPYVYGTGDDVEEITTAISTVKYRPVSYTPEVVQKGNLDTRRSTYNDFSFRLLANSWLKSKYLNWAGENGLFENRHKNWARFWATRLPASRNFQYNFNILEMVKLNITEPFRSAEGDFIIEKMETDFYLTHIGETTIEGYKK